MKWLKNESELFQFLNDMKMENKVANLDNYILWSKEQSLNNTAKASNTNMKIYLSVSDKPKKFLIY
ncbi:TPA: hypothetical protein IXI33_001965 [Enterococcus faecium]|nr:hypothetical protein [Enterococcus faecium Ef_aus0018]HAQ2074400.1 hypothetical protein [Enterococcus faecium]HAQ2131745.1 hypothetical protein [Enterococcus faecium]HAQ2183133.1 hypothetical protein [Enterococcus faecium]HCR4221378.1 hypothetical protein [Enterococcus faecium]